MSCNIIYLKKKGTEGVQLKGRRKIVIRVKKNRTEYYHWLKYYALMGPHFAFRAVNRPAQLQMILSFFWSKKKKGNKRKKDQSFSSSGFPFSVLPSTRKLSKKKKLRANPRLRSRPGHGWWAAAAAGRRQCRRLRAAGSAGGIRRRTCTWTTSTPTSATSARSLSLSLSPWAMAAPALCVRGIFVARCSWGVAAAARIRGGFVSWLIWVSVEREDFLRCSVDLCGLFLLCDYWN